MAARLKPAAAALLGWATDAALPTLYHVVCAIDELSQFATGSSDPSV
jgi:hypothetical protein